MIEPIVLYQPSNSVLLFDRILGSSKWPKAHKQFKGGVSGVDTLHTNRDVCAQWRVWPKTVKQANKP